MKSKISKLSVALLPFACSLALTSCQLGKSFSDELDLQTSIPEVMETAKPTGAPKSKPVSSVPAESNLVEIADATGATTSSEIGASSVTGLQLDLPSENPNFVVDIPKPDLGTSAAAAADPLAVPPPQLAITNTSLSELDLPSAGTRVTTTELDPLVPPPGTELATGTPVPPAGLDPALSVPEGADTDLPPLLHGSQSLGDFYREVHSMVGTDIVQDPAEPVTPPAGEELPPVTR